MDEKDFEVAIDVLFKVQKRRTGVIVKVCMLEEFEQGKRLLVLQYLESSCVNF